MVDIVEELRTNKETGARRLESEYKLGLMTLALRFCRDRGDAEELVNRTLAAVVEGIDGYVEQSAFFGWMCRILSNIHAKDMRRKSNATTDLDEAAVAQAEDADAADRIFRDVDAGILRDAIEQLPEDIRKTVVLHYFMDMPVRDVARFLLVPTGTIAWRLHYARMLLAAKLGTAVKKPGVKALLLALLLAALTAAGAAVVVARSDATTAMHNAQYAMHNAQCIMHNEESGQQPAATDNQNIQTSQALAQSNPSTLQPFNPSTNAASTSDLRLSTFDETEESNMNANTRSSIIAAATLAATGAVTANADSIDNYLQLQYLESSGTQAIDTGIQFGRYTRMSFRMQVFNGISDGQIGVIDKLGTDDKYDRFHFNVNNGGKIWVWCDRRNEGLGSSKTDGGTWHDYDINLAENKVYRDGAWDIAAANAPGYVGSTNDHSTIWLFGRNSNTASLKQYATVRFGKVKIWQDGRETDPDRSLLPCMRTSDNVLGMYDTVNNEFLTNVGTGTFTAGPGTLDYVEIPPQILNGEPVCPEVAVKVGRRKLVKDTDYTLAWANNTDTGLGKVTVTPIGNYSNCAAFAVQYLIVPKEKKLPPEYQRIAYLESTQGGKQQIDTLIHPNGNMRVDIKFQSPIPDAMGQVGMIDDVGNTVERFHMGKGDKIFAGIGNQYSPGFIYSTIVGDNWALMKIRTRLENNAPCGWFVLEETNIDKLTNIGTFRADNSTFGLFGRLSNNNNYKTYAAYRVMYMEVKEGDEQVQTHRFVPCRRIADGELGVYDTVANQFLYDTGRAVRGAEVFQSGPDVVIPRRGLIISVR